MEERAKNWNSHIFEFIPFKETPSIQQEFIPDYKWQFHEAEVLIGKNGITPEKRRKVRDALFALYKQIIKTNSPLAYDIARNVETDLFKEKNRNILHEQVQ